MHWHSQVHDRDNEEKLADDAKENEEIIVITILKVICGPMNTATVEPRYVPERQNSGISPTYC